MLTNKVVVVVQDLWKSYLQGNERTPILKGVNLEIQRGERIAIVGPSGSGKTTFLNVVSGLDDADKGSVIILGKDLMTMTISQRTAFRRQHVGFVFQSFNLIQSMTALENVMLPLLMNGESARKARLMAAELLDRVGLSTRKDARPHLLSGGEKQRVAIARAIIHRPSILFADEPTGNLDQETSRQVMNLMRELSEEREQTILLVTHDPAVAAICDQIYRLEGQLVKVENME